MTLDAYSNYARIPSNVSRTNYMLIWFDGAFFHRIASVFTVFYDNVRVASWKRRTDTDIVCIVPFAHLMISYMIRNVCIGLHSSQVT